jgi:hypothetical protein
MKTGLRVAYESEVEKVLLRSFFEPNAFWALDGRKRPILYGLSSFSEAECESIKVKLVSHETTLPTTWRNQWNPGGSKYWCAVCRMSTTSAFHSGARQYTCQLIRPENDSDAGAEK